MRSWPREYYDQTGGETMQRALTAACILVCSWTGILRAQTYPLPGGTVGVPYSLDFGQGDSEFLALLQGTGISITFNYSLTGGNLPPGLTFSSSGLLSGTPTQAGAYSFTLTFGFTINFNDGSAPYSISGPVDLSLNVDANSGPAVAVNPGALNFSLAQGSTSVPAQSLVISNTRNTNQTFTASAAVTTGGNWLSVSPNSGSVGAFSSSSVSVNVNPSGLGAGTYAGSVSISIAPASLQYNVAVIVTVGEGQAQLQLSQSGLRFQTVAAGGAPPSQSITVLNGGGGSLNFSASTSTTSGGSGWLSVAPTSGTATSSASSAATVSINPQGLGQGDYYGQVQFSANGVANSPQTASVVLNVAAANADLGAFVSPTGLIFVGQAGGTNPAAQTISVTNPSPSNLTFYAALFFGQGNNGQGNNKWFTVQPTSGVVNAGTPASISVQPNLSGIASGVYFGQIVLAFAEDGTEKNIQVVLIVVPGAISKTGKAVASAPCTPTKLIPVFTQLGSNFATVAAWPTPIAVTVVDDCGNFLNTGSVTASFSDGDPSLPLASLGGGNWSATWQPQGASSQVVITADAAEAAPPLEGTQSIGGSLQSNPTTPAVYSGGVVSAARFAPNQPLAPGAFTSIYGVHLGAGENPALSLPLATQLGATRVMLGGRALPLQYAGDGQVNAVIPFDVPPNSTQQLIVANGPALSVPEPVVIAPAQPAVFDGSIKDYKPGSQQPVTVDEKHPISAGDVIVIFCAGLGAVDPPLAAGTAAPSSPPAKTKNPVKVTIGEKNAPVIFSGLAPGFAGLYQVNVQVPTGITPGDKVPVVLSVMGFNSAPVTVAIK